MRRFDDKVAVVTGGLSGIGRACGERLAAEGATVYALDVTDHQRPVDVTDEAAVEAWFTSLPGPPDVLVNAAGVGGLARVTDMPFADWRRVLAINLDGTFLCLRAVARRLRQAGRPGAIVNVASINHFWPLNGFSAYCASKAGVAMLTKVAALELGPHGIRVNAVAPGPIDTPLVAALHDLPGGDAAVAERTPFEGRWGTPAEVAAVVAFLASDDGRWVVGQTITVDGGHSLVGEPDFLQMAEAQSQAPA